MMSPFRTVGIARIAANARRMGASCGQDEAGGPDVTEPVKKLSGKEFPDCVQKICTGRHRTGLNFALGKPEKSR
jgi:hypothetical protein